MERTFRPKGTSVKAIQLDGEKAFEYAADWCAGQEVNMAGEGLDSEPAVKVPTLDGVKIAYAGDYIVRVKGTGFHVMKPADFEDRYEPVRNTRSEG